ncbi:hypothetical protein QSV34_06040 [Porticoccus sp. W117]|uniref:hypothetical protein n=1 Tax=Porticoccus sp. W117 TaxID=3054777 RepID=UPI00259935F6|nr:hypothetical protein [Porticoccus sp. W117]MDM3870913.1 hypothetical protein [Porticoccus sp. W117]
MSLSVTHITAWMLLLMGLSVVLNPKGWQQLFRDTLDNPQRAMPLFLFFLFFGLFIVTQHDIWRGKGLVVSIVGWGAVIKSVIYLSAPQWMAKFRRFAEPQSLPLMRVAGVVWVVVGAWILFF